MIMTSSRRFSSGCQWTSVAMGLFLALHGTCRDSLSMAEGKSEETAAENAAVKPGKWDDFRVRTVRGLQIGHGKFQVNRATQGGKLTEEQVQLVDEMGKVGSQVSLLARRGEYSKAIQCLETTIAIMLEVFGDEYPTAHSLLPMLAEYCEEQGDVLRAHVLLQHVLDEAIQVFARSAERLAEIRVAHQRLAKVREFNPQERQTYEKYRVGKQHMRGHHLAGRYRQAASAAEQMKAWARQLFGEDSGEYALALNNLAASYQDLQRLEQCLPIQRDALERLRKTYGERHSYVITAVGNVASAYEGLGNIPLAAQWYEEAVKLSRDPETGADNLKRISELAQVYGKLGRFEEAKDLLRRANAQLVENQKRGLTLVGDQESVYSAIASLRSLQGDYLNAITAERLSLQAIEQSYGRESTMYSAALTDLGVNWFALGDRERAHDLFVRAQDIKRKLLGENHPSFAKGEQSLAAVLQEAGDFQQAEQLLLHSLNVLQNAYGDDHVDLVTGYGNLGRLYVEWKRTDKAEEYLERAAQIAVRAGETGLEGLGSIRHHQAFLNERLGKLKEAEACSREAYSAYVKSHGEEDANINTIRLVLARILEAQGDRQSALRISQQALSHLEAFIAETVLGLSERQRLQLIGEHRRLLDYYLHLTSTTSPGDPSPNEVYARSLKWKGVVAEQAQAERLISGLTELADAWRKLRQLRSRYASLAFAVPAAGQRAVWSEQLQQLRTEKEDLEADLSKRSAAFRQVQQDVSVDELAGAIPAEVVFIDFFQYGGTQTRLAAFVVRRGQPVERVEFGDAAVIAQSIDTWRAALQDHETARLTAAAAELHRLILRPLQPHLPKSGTLIVSPDGAVHRIPFAALPSADGERYLIESYTIGYALSARQLFGAVDPEQSLPEAGDSRPGLAAVGAVEYGPANAPAGDPQAWTPHLAAFRSGFSPLPGTAVEVQSIARLFRATHSESEVVMVHGKDADETRVKSELARKPHFIHLATHGFFAPPTVISAMRKTTETPRLEDGGVEVRGLSPWLLSGLVFSPSPEAERPQADGILTAEEVNGLDLHGTRLVVLSACDTGLGDVAGGEGVLGLQRAFRVAGARRLLTSLWKVDDASTALLMDRFYAGIWRHGMSEIEASRQAQLALLQSPSELTTKRRQLAEQLPSRGLVLEGQPSAAAAPDTLHGRTHPRLWAAFVLSGSLLDDRPK